MYTSSPNLNIQYPQCFAIIVAGGLGSRMQAGLPKQFLPLCGKPILMHTIAAFYNSSLSPKIMVVLHPGYHDQWKQLCMEHHFVLEHMVIAGGETRFHSVKNAVDLISDNNVLIAVHDAVRPLVATTLIDAAYQCAAKNGSAVTAVKSRDSVRRSKDRTSENLNRDDIYLVQTPQTFQSALIKKAYQQPYEPAFTDDATVVEKSGAYITLVEGSHSNIKITYPDDIFIAEALIKMETQQ